MTLHLYEAYVELVKLCEPNHGTGINIGLSLERVGQTGLYSW
jgi:hypothetical protein